MDHVHGCGVISDGDVDFGRVLQPVNDVCVSKPSDRVSADRLTHPNAEQCSGLLSVLDEFAIVLATGQACTQGQCTVSRRRRS